MHVLCLFVHKDNLFVRCVTMHVLCLFMYKHNLYEQKGRQKEE